MRIERSKYRRSELQQDLHEGLLRGARHLLSAGQQKQEAEKGKEVRYPKVSRRLPDI
ncbi:MAG: hypothetical protein LVQ95_04680 [Candidatus Micrarchaeales archaeon]|nr:hypothetical protein [Candidatus Micrarchaeales archaeon]